MELSLRLLEVLDHSLDRADLQAPFPRKSNACLAAHHAGLLADRLAGHLGAVVDQFADDGRRLLAGHPAEVYGRLGMSPSLPNAAELGAEGDHMPRSSEAVGRRIVVRERPAGQGAVVRADSGSDGGVGGVDGQGVGRQEGVFVALDHLRQLELDGPLWEYGRADQPRAVPDHEGHLLCGDILRRNDDVGFVLASRVVENNYEFAIFCKTWSQRCTSGLTQRVWGIEAESQVLRGEFDSRNALTVSETLSNSEESIMEEGMVPTCVLVS